MIFHRGGYGMASIDSEIEQARSVKGSAILWWLGQSGYAVKGAHGGAVLVDPFMSDSISHGYRPYTHERLVPPPLNWHDEGALEPETVLVTHEHADHCDNVYLTRLAQNTSCRFVGPEPVAQLMYRWDIPEDRVTVVSPGERIQLGSGQVQVVKAVHIPYAVGYLFGVADGPTIYFAGDTGLFLGMRDIGSLGIDCAVLPINGQYDNLGIDGALEALALIRPTVVIPCHYGMFADNTERPERLSHALAKSGLDTEIHIMNHAEKVVIYGDQ